MIRFVESAAAIVAAVVVSLFFSLQSPGAAAAAKAEDGHTGKGIVYLVRGGFDIFSTGLDRLAEELRDRGVDARTLGQAGWQKAADEAIERYKEKRQPVVFVGHSFGANAAMLMARYLGDRGVPVALVVLFDPTEAFAAPGNVKRLLNFLSLDSTGMDFNVWTTPEFSGHLENIVHSELSHLTIDDDAELHKQTIAEIVKLVGGSRRALQ